MMNKPIALAAGAVPPAGLALLMATTMLAGAPARAADAAAASAGGAVEVGELIVTSSKREENIQKVPMSIQAIDTRKLTQLNITGFNDYVKYMPSVGYQNSGPNTTSIYMRGVASGDNANHSGPLPSVGTYLDEQPITTIGGTLDVHIYDIARVEVLPGPQGTLYGASSESGTLRIITNKPTTSGFSAGYDLQGNYVDHGGLGGVAEGFVNIPLGSHAAIRLVGFGERDSGYIDNVHGTRPFATSGETIDNASLVKNDFNHVDSFGGRAALKVDLGENWTITPSVMAQELWAPGVFGYNPAVGDLKVQRFSPDRDHDSWVQAALTVTGKLGPIDLTYSGGYFYRALDTQSDYTDYSIAYDQHYGSGAYWDDAEGNPLPKHIQMIFGRDRFDKQSHELRIASPADNRFRFIGGLFVERQTHWIIQDYQIQGFGPQIAVDGWPNTIWLTDQNRIDRDEAIFTEVSYDITPKFTITGGVRGYHYKNSLYGFYGYSAGYSSHTGESQCFKFPGQTFRNAPCVNLNKTIEAGGETHKINLTYKVTDDALVYFTYSTGYRPGGVNRSGDLPPYQADELTNYEIGWKTAWLDHTLHINGAVYDEEWNKFQFSFLGPNSLTIIENAPAARILGIEGSLDWRASDHLTISGGAAYNHAELAKNFCGTDQATGDLIPTCPDADAQAVHGQQLPYTPRFKGDITGRYTFPLMGWNAHLQASLLYQTRNYIALRTNDPITHVNEVALQGIAPDYFTADLTAGIERNHLSFEVYLKNAFDSRGQTNRYTPCTLAICGVPYPGTPPAIYVVPIQPLTVGIRVGQTF